MPQKHNFSYIYDLKGCVNVAVYFYDENRSRHSYITEDFDYDLTGLLIEILTKDEPIKDDADYIDSDETINSSNIWKYQSDPVFVELKSDMSDFCDEIKREILKIDGVDSVTITPSKSVGFSTYITVNFTKPPKDSKLNSDYINGYGGEYKLKFRLSNHQVSKATDADVLIDLLGKKFDQFKTEVLNIVTQRVQQLSNYYRDFKNTKKVSASQKQRNKERKARQQSYNTNVVAKKNKYNGNKGYNNYSWRQKESFSVFESFGRDRLYSMLDTGTVEYLDTAHTNLEEIVSMIEEHFGFKDYDYVTLLRTTADCLNSYIIEYTFEEGIFNYDLLFADMQEQLDNSYSKNKLLV